MYPMATQLSSHLLYKDVIGQMIFVFIYTEKGTAAAMPHFYSKYLLQ